MSRPNLKAEWIAAFAAWLALVLLLTVLPLSSGGIPGFDQREIADAVRNFVFFLPLGWLIAIAAPSPAPAARWAFVMAAVLSGGIETFQAGVPGRDPALSDFLANVAGTLGGVWVHTSWQSRRRGWLRGGTGDLLGLAIFAVGVATSLWLASPASTPGPVFVHLDHRLDYVQPVDGKIESVELGGACWTDGWATGLTPRDIAPLGDRDIVVRLRPDADPTAEMRSILVVSDLDQGQVSFLARSGHDLIFQYGTVGLPYGFERLAERWPGVFADFGPDDSILVEVTGDAREICLVVGGEERCGFGLGWGDGWSLIAPGWGVSSMSRTRMGAAWVGLQAIGLGLWLTRSRRPRWALAAAVALLWLLPAALGVRSPNVAEGVIFIGAAAGTLALSARRARMAERWV